MKVRFWGTRGSIPAPGPSTVRYGGNTSCVEVRLSDGSLLILDAGTGIRELGRVLGQCEATLLFSHYHWDHIQGLPFFTPAYLKGSHITIYGPTCGDCGPTDYLHGQMDYPYFPAEPTDLAGVARMESTPGAPFRIGPATVRSARMSHPGVTLGYRIEDAGQTLVYMSDDEPEAADEDLRDRVIELAAGADLLIHDCQYTEGEYPSHRGWGHSTPRQLCSIALPAAVGHVVMFHHDPAHSDDDVEAMAEEVRNLAEDRDVTIAAEGAVITLDDEGVRSSAA